MGMEGDYDTRNYEDDLGNRSRIFFEAKGEEDSSTRGFPNERAGITKLCQCEM
jgi:hypothetical protein